MERRYILNANIGDLGVAGEIVWADPELWGVRIDAGFMSEVDDHGNRIVQWAQHGFEDDEPRFDGEPYDPNAPDKEF